MPSQPNLGRVNGFVLLKFLGKGTFGAVYEARREEDGKVYAIKKVDTRRMSAKERAEAVNEIRVLASMAGPHVITFYEAFVEADILYIVTEFATHGDLFAFLKSSRRRGRLPESTVWSIFIQMCLGVRTLHDKNILHRDLKAANVFMCSSNYLKLGDFGVSKVLKHSEALARTQVGTPYYVAPEVWRNRPYNNKCDMWSLGCLLYELCTYRPPFEAESMEGLARKIMKGKYDPVPAGYSKELHELVSMLLVVEPNRRASVDDVLGHSAVLRRMGDLPPPPGVNDTPPPQNPIDIVRTIQVPRRFNDLTKNLPAARYDTPLPTPSYDPAEAGGGAAKAKANAGDELQALNAVLEAPPKDEGEWRRRQPGQAPPQRVRVAPKLDTQQRQLAGMQQPSKQAGAAHRSQAAPSALAAHAHRGAEYQAGTPQQQQQLLLRQRAAERSEAETPLRLPRVPGAEPRPSEGRPAYTPSVSREIRVVYHNPSNPYAPSASKVSIFRANQQQGGGTSYYNPITHQQINRFYPPGSSYHMRNQPQPGGTPAVHSRIVATPQQQRYPAIHGRRRVGGGAGGGW